MPPLTLREVAERLGGEPVGPPELTITGASGYDSAQEGDLTFADSPRLLALAEKSRATAVIVPRSTCSCAKPMIRADNPRLAFAQALRLFFPRHRAQPGLHPTAVIGENVEMGPGTYVGPHVVIGDRARVGREVELHALACIGAEVELGDETIVYPQVTIYPGVRIGRRCILHAGCVIGGDGFGFVPTESGEYIKVPQVGTVIIEDDVEIGANSAVDRATTNATIIGRGTKIDNLVQVGHNCKVGANCIICGQVGLSGSVTIEDGAVLAGQAGIADHLTIGAGATVCAQAGVIGNIPAGAVVSGYPAGAHREQMRVQAALHKLPGALAELRALRRRLEQLEESVRGRGNPSGAPRDDGE